jgi:antitoxin component of MazEF toxin-antitoxin module
MEDGVLKKLTAIGNSKGIILDRTLLQILDVPEDATHVELKVEDGKLVIQRTAEHSRRVRELSKRMLATHRRAFKRLADS